VAGVKLESISKKYLKSTEAVVKDLSLDITDGEFLVILGPSGCGKSTTLRMIAGLERITAGQLFIGEKDVTRVPAKERDIAMVFQSYALYPHMTVWKNIAFGLLRRKIPKEEVKRKVARAAQMLGLEGVLDRKPAALSGGQRQRVALARGIVRDPAVFLFDEPLSNLDAALRSRTRDEMIRQHHRLETTMIYVTHDQVEAMTMGERICIMRDGEVVQVGEPMDVYRNPADTFVAEFLGSPPMNVVKLECASGDGQLQMKWGTQRVCIQNSSAAGNAAQSSSIVMGIRPEDVVIGNGRTGDSSEKNELIGRIGAVETLGAEVVLEIDFDGVDTRFKARVSPDTRVKSGERISVVLPEGKIKLFEAESGRALAAGM